MQDFLFQFGIDWKLFASQLVNFALLLIILRIFIYKPLIKILRDRRMKIEEGMQKAREAGMRLEEADEMFKKRIKEAESKCVLLLNAVEKDKKKCESELVIGLKKKEEELIRKAELLAESREKEAYKKINKEAAELLRAAIAKAVELEPAKIDELLIKKAVYFLQEKNEILS